MTTQEVANRLVELNRMGPEGYKAVYDELYSPDILSVENWGDREEYAGMDAIKAKGEKWESGLEEMHSMSCSEPLVADKSFAVTFTMDVTFNEASGMPGRMQMTELAVYRLNDEGKIIHEEFTA